jgi:hypothetical protein
VLEAIALDVWRQPRGRVVRIANGIPLADFAAVPPPDALPRLVKQPGSAGWERWPGCVRSRTCPGWSAPLPPCRMTGGW